MTSLGQAVSAALIQFIWQGSVVALLLLVAEFVLQKRSAQSRYLAGCIALAFLAALPVATGFVLYRPATAPGTRGSGRDWTLLLWSAGVLIFSLRPAWSLTRVCALRRKGTPPEEWIAELGRSVAKRTGLTRAFRILISSISDTPAVVGWLRPVILLPAATVAGLSVEQLETILAHEIAHIRRHDYLVNLLQVLVETLLFYHPAVWWVSSRIRRERELCCDDEVVRFVNDPILYARALTTLERLRNATPAVAVGSAGGQLSYRIRRLVGIPPLQPERWPAILALALALMCLTTTVRWARAQQADDKLTVEITRNAGGIVTGVRVASGPSYLATPALLAALQSSPPSVSAALSSFPSELPSELRVRTVTFPDAFRTMRNQNQTLADFFADEVTQAEKDLQAAKDPGSIHAAREKLAKLKIQKALTQENNNLIHRPEKLWNVEVARHQLEEFRKQYQGKLPDGSHPEAQARYLGLQQAVVTAERELRQP